MRPLDVNLIPPFQRCVGALGHIAQDLAQQRLVGQSTT